MKPEEMTAEEFEKHLFDKTCSFLANHRAGGDPKYEQEYVAARMELKARLRGYEAMKKQAEYLSTLDDNGEAHEVQVVQSAGKSVLAEMERARNYPQSARAGR